MRFFNPPPPLAHRFREHSKVNSRNFLRAAQPESVAHKEHTSPSKDIEEQSSTKDDLRETHASFAAHSWTTHDVVAWLGQTITKNGKKKNRLDVNYDSKVRGKRVELKRNLSTVSVISFPEN